MIPATTVSAHWNKAFQGKG